MDSFALDPIAYGEEGGAPPAAEIAGWRSLVGSDIPAGRNDPQPTARHTLCYKLVGQRLARHEKAAGAAVCQAIQAGLNAGA